MVAQHCAKVEENTDDEVRDRIKAVYGGDKTNSPHHLVFVVNLLEDTGGVH